MKRLRGVAVFGTILIIVSVLQIIIFIGRKDDYMVFFQPLPERIILLRYALSLLFRITCLAAGIGILFLKETWRKILLFLGFFTIATIYWKHPISVFKKFIPHSREILQAKGLDRDVQELALSIVPWMQLIFNYAVEIVFWGCLIYYFTRPQVKEQFRKSRIAKH